MYADKAPARSAADVTNLVDWLIDMHLPEGTPPSCVTVAIESAYCGVNVGTGLKLAELRGRIEQEVERRGWSVVLVAPSAWRKTTIKPPAKTKRKALKAMSVAYVFERYDLTVTDDVADAVCIGEHVGSIFGRFVDDAAQKSQSPTIDNRRGCHATDPS